jgi:hypothetical protein
MELEISNEKPRSVSFARIESGSSQLSAKLIPLDLKKLREERLINKTSTPKYDKRVRSDTLFKIYSIEEQ